ncbi:BTAD domain-containing putative transcriptional regulator [Streptomyces sp. NPDC057245]|uniref:AfsR/SARP family transcriptional regulator n=1 Tax=Streptomyces sp. NPDC057245 TaxID=3346065 RepID=UPI003641E1BB
MTELEPSLYFSVLGPVRAWRGEHELDLGSPQQRVTLAALLLGRGRPVALGELIHAVWGEEPPKAAVSVVRTYASRLRKVLETGPQGRLPELLVSVGDGYLIRVGDDSLDLAVFERRVAQAKKLQTAGDLADAAALLREALDAWQGPALAGLPGPLAESEESRLAEQRLGALETRLDIDVVLGRHDTAVPELLALTAKHPLREQLCQLLMLALYRSGRQAEALAAYRSARSSLVAELGIEPGASLRDLHDRILAGDRTLLDPPTLDPPTAAAHGPVPSAAPAQAGDPAAAEPHRPGTAVAPAPPADQASAPAEQPPSPAQLPSDLPTFVGRQSQLDHLRTLLPDNGGPPATLVISSIGGMAGIGKSALAVHWAHEVADRFPDGQLYVSLRGFDPNRPVMAPEEALRILLDALGVSPARIPSDFDAQVSLYRSTLARRRVLLLLDNARDSEQVRPLLPGSAGSLVIVTSRNHLAGLTASEGAHPLTLDQMTPVEAFDVLAARLGDERLTAEPRAAGEIITRCGRLPLALAIVAAHAAARPGFPLSVMAEEVRDNHSSLDAFAGGDDSATDVRAVFSWSYRALPAPAARLFRLLGLHSGSDISAPAVAALAGVPLREIRAVLAELTRAHLLTEHFPGRYVLHDLLRDYAGELAGTEDTERERDEAVGRLLAWYLHTADAAYPHITPNRPRIPAQAPPAGCRPLEFTTREEALEWCETERGNLVDAVHQAAGSGHAGIAWRLPAVLWGFFYLRSHTHDWLDTTTTGLAAARAAGDRRGEAQGLVDTSAALRGSGMLEETIGPLHEAMAICEELGDTAGMSTIVANLGDAYLLSGQPGNSVEYTLRALAIARDQDDAWSQGIGLANLGDAYRRLGRLDEAVTCLEQALTFLRKHDNRWVEGVALDMLGTVYRRLHRYDDAVSLYHQALTTHREVGNRWGEGYTLGNLGDAQMHEDPEAARSTWLEALEILSDCDHADAEKIQERLDRLA